MSGQIKFTPPPSGGSLQSDMYGGAMEIAKGIPNAIALRNFKATQALGAALQHATHNGVVDYRAARAAAANNPDAAVGYNNFLQTGLQQRGEAQNIHLKQINYEAIALKEVAHSVATGKLSVAHAKTMLTNLALQTGMAPADVAQMLGRFPNNPNDFPNFANALGNSMLGSAASANALQKKSLYPIDSGNQINLATVNGMGVTGNAGTIEKGVSPSVQKFYIHGQNVPTEVAGGSSSGTGVFNTGSGNTGGAPAVIPIGQGGPSVPSGYTPLGPGGESEGEPGKIPVVRAPTNGAGSVPPVVPQPTNTPTAPGSSSAPAATGSEQNNYTTLSNGAISINGPVANGTRIQILQRNVAMGAGPFGGGERVPGAGGQVLGALPPGSAEAAKEAVKYLSDFRQSAISVQRSLANLTSMAATEKNRNQGFFGGVETDVGSGLNSMGFNVKGTNSSQEYIKEAAGQALADAAKVGNAGTDYRTGILVDSLPRIKNTKVAGEFVRNTVEGATEVVNLGIRAQESLGQTNLNSVQQSNVLEQFVTKISPLALAYGQMDKASQANFLHELSSNPQAYDQFRAALNGTARALNAAVRTGLISSSANPFGGGK